MLYLGIVAGSFLLIGLLLALLRRPRDLPPLPLAEALPPDRRRAALVSLLPALARRKYAPLQGDRRARPLLRRLLRCPENLAPLVFLRDNGRELLMALHSLLDARPWLPGGGEPRLMALCRRHLASGGGVTHGELLSFLETLQGEITLPERLCLPQAMAAALSRQLSHVLMHLGHSVAETRKGARLAHRLIRARRPMALLNARQPSLAETQAMVNYLHQRQETALLAALEERLRQQDDSLLHLAETHAAQQALLTDHLRRILDSLRTLEKLDWPALLESIDPLHQALLHDPTGTYPAMDGESRLFYRRRAWQLSRLFAVEEARLVKDVLILCGAADPDGLRDHVGWYLLEPQGMDALRRHLHVRRGFLSLRAMALAPWVRRVVLGIAALASGLVFLHSGHPLGALPLWLGVSSCYMHRFLGLIDHPHPLPRMEVKDIPEEMRTLIVLPTVLADTTQAVPAVRRLLLARKALPKGAVDCLLLGDYAPSMTQTASQDESLLMAARMATDAVNGDGGQFIYLHRRRVWDGVLRAYAGPRSALDGLNRLMVHGDSSDEYDEATVSLTFLHRRYAYVLVLDSDTLPGSDALLPLLGAMAHPLNQRRHTPEGWRGVSVLYPRAESNPANLHSRIGLCANPRSSACLYRPYSLLEATEGYAPSQPLAGSLLAGTARTSTPFYSDPPANMHAWFTQVHRRFLDAWRLLPWLLSHVKTPGGVRRNPLSSHDQYTLRQELRTALTPLCRLLLLFYGLLARSMPLMLLALLSPEASSPGSLLVQFLELPMRTALALDALVDVLRQHLHPRASRSHLSARLPALENWSHGLAALAFTVAALALKPLSLPGLVLAGCFACFPLARPWLDAPLRPTPRPTPEMETSLLEIAQATWQFFEETVTPATHHLPPESLQLKPWRGADDHTTPGGTGLYLLSCLAMRELGLISTQDMCRCLHPTISTLEQLPRWHGLPYARYDLSTREPVSPYVESAGCGVLCTCLITLAQGLRSYLSEMPDEHHTLPRRADRLARSMELQRLYDHKAQLFFAGFHTAEESPTPSHHQLFAGEGLLLSFAAVMQRRVPLGHMQRLGRVLVRLGAGAAYISQRGTAAEYLLPALLLPAPPTTMMECTLRRVIHAQRHHGVEGMFGMSESGFGQFDPQLNYLRQDFGLPEAALGPCSNRTVIAPYAAALCLPFALEEAHGSLMRLRSRGLMSRLGFYESIDFCPAHLPSAGGEAVVQSHNARHQGMLLCSVCNALTGNILSRHFISVPQAASTAMLLWEKPASRLHLPPRCIHPENAIHREPSFRRSARLLAAPVDAHIIGSQEAMLLMSAQGMGVMRSRGVNLTRFTGDPTACEGIRFYLNDGLETFSLTDPALSGDTAFAEGSMRFIRTCGQLRTTLTALTDPVQGAFLHVVEVANLTQRERTFDLASCLVPDLQADDMTIETGRPEERVLTLTRRPGPEKPRLTLCHAISTHEPLMALAAETDLMAFQGHQRTLNRPAAMDEPLGEGLVGAPVNPCASFRARLKLGPRGRAAVIFVTRLMNPGEAFSLENLSPRLSDVEGIATLSGLLSRTMTDSLSISQAQAAELSRLFGPLMWHSQPHQGALSPLSQPPSALRALGIHPEEPMLLIVIHSDGCTPLLQEAAAAAAWLRLMGQPVQLCVLCQGEQAAQTRNLAWKHLRSQPSTLLTTADLANGLRETLEASARLILFEGAGTITAQLEALALQLPAIPLPEDSPPPAPETDELRFDNGIGGFQPGTNDYIIHSPAPTPWRCLLTGDSFATRCTESGLGVSMTGGLTITRSDDNPIHPTPAECVYLSGGGSILTAESPGHGCRVQLSPGVAAWNSWGSGLETTLTAATLSSAAFGLRTLRIKNTGARPRDLRLTITARFHMGDEAFTCLTPVEGGVVAASPNTELFGCLALADGTCTSRAVSPLAFHGYGALPDLDAPADETGTVALLSLDATLPEGGSITVTWILGACRHMDEAEALLARIRKHGASAMLREVRREWATRLNALTISTPDGSLDLLMNHILPRQVHTVPSLWNAAALAYARPHAARALLLADTAHVHGPRQLLLPYLTGWYIRVTGDKNILTQGLLDRCMDALAAVRLGIHGLPLAEGMESSALGLFFACALQSFMPWAENPGELEEVRTRLVESLERTSWDGAWYIRSFLADGIALGSASSHACRIDSLPQSLAVAALGITERTALAAGQSWQHLFDPRRGLLRQFAPPFDGHMNPSPFSACVPGLKENGAHHTTDAIWMLRALAALSRPEEAWLLLSALNPIHHGENPQRFIAEPYVLPEYLFTHPQQLGRGSGVSEGAGFLYATVLEKLLGFEKRGDQVRLRPMVPPGWDEFTITLQWGSSTWRFHAGAGEPFLTLDGQQLPGGWITLVDDGRIHEVRTPLRRG